MHTSSRPAQSKVDGADGAAPAVACWFYQPDLVDTILSECTCPTLMSLRGTNKAMRSEADKLLTRHIIISCKGAYLVGVGGTAVLETKTRTVDGSAEGAKRAGIPSLYALVNDKKGSGFQRHGRDLLQHCAVLDVCTLDDLWAVGDVLRCIPHSTIIRFVASDTRSQPARPGYTAAEPPANFVNAWLRSAARDDPSMPGHMAKRPAAFVNAFSQTVHSLVAFYDVNGTAKDLDYGPVVRYMAHLRRLVVTLTFSEGGVLETPPPILLPERDPQRGGFSAHLQQVVILLRGQGLNGTISRSPLDVTMRRTVFTPGVMTYRPRYSDWPGKGLLYPIMVGTAICLPKFRYTIVGLETLPVRVLFPSLEDAERRAISPEKLRSMMRAKILALCQNSREWDRLDSRYRARFPRKSDWSDEKVEIADKNLMLMSWDEYEASVGREQLVLETERAASIGPLEG